VSDLGTAVAALEGGKPVVIPTDTVYGLAALPGIPGAVAGLFRVKGRPDGKPVAVLAGGWPALAGVGVLDSKARALGKRFWPGPLTIVVPRAPGFDVDLGGGRGIALRVPDCGPALDLLGLTGPLAVTSANRSGSSPATTVDEARSIFGPDIDVYIDAGRCAGAPSTVVSLLGSEPEILRAGPIGEGGIAAALNG
jgi:L-threonylcarbamoyladenylate synthase